ncbi:hypothetical protein J7E24_08470 [Hymenobacter sp. ISL-91]|uniref:hypothetical protein n=1 Tax=Hymenobacter sp. ISL-91 TaxID=2819151 RepID=UPI001BEB2057|nr:hypothetical protein [Hymenobacter sp. ISL-91]MBT2557817.1 hypothetical protein [Hymenobacter sp. ISL-91]
MKTSAILMMIFLNSILSFGQVENRWQSDSVYRGMKVKRIFVYENSPKDLSEIIELDRNGKKVRVENYNASYNNKSRKLKSIDRVAIINYDELGKINEKIDTVFYYDNTFSIEKTYFYYEGDMLTSSKYFKGNFIKPTSETIYSHHPFTSTTSTKIDTVVTYKKTKEYEKKIYVKRFYGYVLEAKLKEKQIEINGIIGVYSYSNEADRQRFYEEEITKNIFNEKGQLLKFEIKSIFRNDRTSEYDLIYTYEDNGLLKSIRVYVPLYYKYEYFD